MRDGTQSLFALGTIALVLVSFGAMAGCVRHQEPQQLSRALESADDITDSIGRGDVKEARIQFSNTHASFHATASEVRVVDPSIAEVVDDFTEALKARLAAPGTDRDTLLDITSRTRAWLETAHIALDGNPQGAEDE